MINKSGSPRRGSGSADSCGLLAFITFFVVAVTLSILISSCSVPAGGGSGSSCEWERKRVKPRSHSLTIVSPTITFSTVAMDVSRPVPARPASGPKISVVKPKPGRPAGRVVRTGRKPVRMPRVKPHKPTYSPGNGHKWVLDCD